MPGLIEGAHRGLGPRPSVPAPPRAHEGARAPRRRLGRDRPRSGRGSRHRPARARAVSADARREAAARRREQDRRASTIEARVDARSSAARAELGAAVLPHLRRHRRRRARAARSDVAAAGGSTRAGAAAARATSHEHRGASASSAARSIRFTAATSTSARAAEAALDLTRAVRRSRRTSRRTGRSRSRRAFTASRWWRWRSPAAPAGARRTSSCAHDAPSYTSATLQQFHERGYAPSRAVLRHRRRRVRRDRDAGRTTRRSSTRAHFAVVSRPGLSGRRAAATGCRSWRRRMVRPPLDAIGADRSVDHFDRRADRRCVIDCDPPAPRRAASRSRASCRRRVQQHIEQHGLYTSTTPGRRGSDAPADAGGRQVAWPRLRSAARRRAFRRRSSARSRAAEDKKARRSRRARSAEGGGVHRLLRDLLGHATRGRFARSPTRVMEALAADGVKPAHVEGYDRSEWILLDYFDFIVHVFAPETRDVLRPRAALGQRRAHRASRAVRDQLAPSARRRSCDAAPLRRPRAALRRLRRARSNIRRAGRSATPAGASILPLTPPLCDRCGDPLPTWRVDQPAAGALPALPARAARRRPRARDRRVRRRAARDRPRAEVRRTPIAGAAAGRADARARRRRARRAPTARSRCRSIRRGGASAASIRRPISRGICGLPVVAALRRVRATPTQTGLPAAQRHRQRARRVRG